MKREEFAPVSEGHESGSQQQPHKNGENENQKNVLPEPTKIKIVEESEWQDFWTKKKEYLEIQKYEKPW